MPISNAILNQEGKIDHYVCTGCSCNYKARFKDTTLCCNCLIPVFHDIEVKLSELTDKEKTRNESFRNNWVNKKTKKK